MRYKREEPFRYTFREPAPALFQIIMPEDKEESSQGMAYMIDISPNGMRLNSELNIPIESKNLLQLSITFNLNDEELTYVGSIVWQKDKGATYDYGVELRMDENYERELIEQLKLYSRNRLPRD